MKEDKYIKRLPKNQVYSIVFYARYSEKHFTQIYKALYGDVTIKPPRELYCLVTLFPL